MAFQQSFRSGKPCKQQILHRLNKTGISQSSHVSMAATMITWPCTALPEMDCRGRHVLGFPHRRGQSSEPTVGRKCSTLSWDDEPMLHFVQICLELWLTIYLNLPVMARTIGPNGVLLIMPCASVSDKMKSPAPPNSSARRKIGKNVNASVVRVGV